MSSEILLWKNNLQDWEVWEINEYPESSVLAGQMRVSLVDQYPSERMALVAYPNAVVTDSRPRPVAVVSSCPPSDFDPLDAGEEW